MESKYIIHLKNVPPKITEEFSKKLKEFYTKKNQPFTIASGDMAIIDLHTGKQIYPELKNKN